MENLQDIQALALAEIKHFRNKNRRNPLAEGYLWYYPTVPGRNGGLMASEDTPGPEWSPVDPEGIRRDMSPEQYVTYLTVRNILSRLPVLALAENPRNPLGLSRVEMQP